jgi:hypothetical protein
LSTATWSTLPGWQNQVPNIITYIYPSSKNEPNRWFVNYNTKLFFWKRVASIFWLFGKFSKTIVEKQPLKWHYANYVSVATFTNIFQKKWQFSKKKSYDYFFC